MQTARSLLFLAATLSSVVARAQTKTFTGKCVYRVASSALALPLPDTILNQIGIPKADLKISAGTMQYTTYYREGYARTDIAFVPEPGIQLRNSDEASLFTRQKDSAQFFFENGKEKFTQRYTLPVLEQTGERKTIRDYECEAYAFNGDSLKAVIWFCAKLPQWVSPGLYYPKRGGIVLMEFSYPNKKDAWSAELLSYAETTERIDFRKDLARPKGEPKPLFFFRNKGGD